MVTDQDEEISITSVLFFVKRATRYLLKRWIIILLVAAAGGVAGYFYAKSKKPTYTASLTFVLSSESRAGGYAGLAGQLGFASVNAGGSDLFAGDNIVTLFRSRKMIQSALFKVPPGQKDNLLNILAREYKFDKIWQKQKRLKNAFPFPNDAAKLTGVQDSLIRHVHAFIVWKNLSVGRPAKYLSYYSLSTTSTNETFSFYFTHFLMNETANFFIDTKTRLAKQNLQMIQKEADSLRSLLSNTITATAASVDRTYNLNPALQVQRAPIQRRQANTTFLTNVYNEVAQNVVVAKLNLQKEIPLYQIIDPPTLPLQAIYSNARLYAVAGFVLFAFIVILVLLSLFFFQKKHQVEIK